MKICLINNLYQPYQRGGAEVVAENQVNDFISQGHDVFVITTQPLFKKINPATSLKYKVYRFYPWNIFSFYYLNRFSVFFRAIWRLLDIFNLHSYFKIKKILTAQKPDIIYTHNLTGIGYLIPKLIKKLKIKNIQVMHDVTLVRPSGLLIYGQEKENILIKIYSRFIRYLFNSPDQVVFPSNWLKNYYTSRDFFPSSERQVIRNFDFKIENLLLNKKIKNKEINFLFAGQIEEHKGILFLIKTFYKLSPYGGSPLISQENSKQKIGGQTTNYKLHIIGTGSKFAQAKKLAANNPNIIFHGYQPAAEFLAQADHIIVPSLCYENSPTVIFESLSAGVPVIASNLGGISELIQNKINGYLFRPDRGQELVFIIKNIYERSKNI
ncbi:hypothetical protein A3B87_00235 [Candidatus Kuenenbacteria bacterium RIFCSPHIGHO2_02_FULL_39_13]|uniref:Glycosyltransferase subfamily 4-like N-terminal domain-containing protein n=1 Tax=Candidatus Kuenenbacteria bacterium RIFCSPHIGHO2_02_FULL_39_13 TaxID=1798561 RepID=A0A1F6FN54_9BACT|nr:MAG: hypothetical protein A3B87_00235 [Candidatus Kuenenbacteria bacterium RIFCSPHIGHO2_02_FULL_39_13]